MDGTGTTTILIFIGVLVLIMVGVIVWQLVKQSRSDYTYKYQNKK